MTSTFAFILLITVVGTSWAMDCYGTPCPDDATHFCQIFLTENRGECYLHHGHGHHEDHQMCLGAHHPHDHCFCHDQACIDQMAKQTTPIPATTGGTTV